MRCKAADALRKLGNTLEGLQALLNLLQDENSSVRSTATAALSKLENAPEVVLQALLNRLQDEVSDVRSTAATVLGKLGKASEVVLQALLKPTSG